MFLFLLQLSVERDIGRKRVARIIDLVFTLSLVGLTVAYLVSSIVNRPTVTEDTDYQTLLASGKQLYENGCRCKNPQIRYGGFLNYTDDSDYQWCLQNLPAEAIFCITSTYQFQAELKGDFNLSSDTIISKVTLQNTVQSRIQTITFNAWNLLSDATLVAKRLISQSLTDHALNGNATQFDITANQVYVKFVDSEPFVRNVTKRIFDSTTFYNDRYLELCEPVGCTVHVKQSIAPLLLIIASVLGGYASVFSGIGNFILDKFEDKYLEFLLDKHINGGGLTSDEMSFLTANSPHFALKIKQMSEKGQKPSMQKMKSLFSFSKHNQTAPIPQADSAPENTIP